MKGSMPCGPLWEAYKSIVAVDGTMLRLIVMPPGSLTLRDRPLKPGGCELK